MTMTRMSFAHSHEHLRDGGGLLIGQAFNLDARDLGDALHELGDLRVEQLGHLLDRGVGYLPPCREEELHTACRRPCANRQE